MKPPFGHVKACCTLKASARTGSWYTLKRYMISQEDTVPERLSRANSYSLIGIDVSQIDAPFSNDASSALSLS